MALKVRVSFTDDAGYAESLTSAPALPDRPYRLAATASGGAVVLSWELPAGWSYTDSVFQILRRRPELGETEPSVHVRFTTTGTTAHTDTDVEPGVLYEYRVKGVDTFGYTGDASAPVEIRTADRAPGDNSPAAGAPTIGGTPVVGETLTVDISGIADADGMTGAALTYRWIRSDGHHDTDIAAATDSSYTLVDSDEGMALKVRVSFTDDAGNAETLTSAPTAVAAALTAEFLNVPTSHDGQTPFTLELRFSDEFSVSYLTLRDHAFTVTGGTVTGARRLEPPGNIRWEITIQPDADTDTAITILLPATENCDNDPGALCTGDDRKLSADVTDTITGPADSSPEVIDVNEPTLRSLSLSGIDLAFASGTESYAVDAAVGVVSTTVTAVTSDPASVFEVTTDDADSAASGHQVSLGFGETVIGVVVTAGDGVTTKTYTVTVDRARRWPEADAQAWGTTHGWLVGANYIPRYASNQLEHWQADTFDIDIIDEELCWAADLGMNVMRVYLHDLLYQHDRAGFLDRVDQYLDVSTKHGIKTILVFFDDVWNPDPQFGPQPEPLPHIHNSQWVQSPGRIILGDLAAHDSLKPYLQDVIAHFDGDDRVIAFELYNEPGNTNRRLRDRGVPEVANKARFSLALMQKTFQWAREVDPAQPVFVSPWRSLSTSIDRYAFEYSDIIGFHSYGNLSTFTRFVNELERRTDRPIIATEYMRRPVNTFEQMLPLMHERGIGAINWGLVNGRSQTIYPWQSWDGTFTAPPEEWFHDVLHDNGLPFDAGEADLIRRLTGTTGTSCSPLATASASPKPPPARG